MYSLGDHDAVISVDLGWSRKNLARTAAAWCEKGQTPQYEGLEEQTLILTFLERFRGKRALVLLDIPVYGVEKLGDRHPFRSLDRTLLALGIPILPSSKAEGYGRDLASQIEGKFPEFEVVETYPYAILRFLWAARHEPDCLSIPLKAVVDTSTFFSDWPPKYKRARRKAERIEHMTSVNRLLAQFMELDSLDALLPEAYITRNQLNATCDIYDALLGLIAGLEMAAGSPWFFPARVKDDHAMIAMLMDENLRKRWDEVIRGTLLP